MRSLFLIMGAGILTLGISRAQSASGSMQVPVGQIFKNFVLPQYENGQLKATLSASQATGITQNRAETLNLVIKLYDNGALTTTITSPKADILMTDHKMRTKNTVRVERTDMIATSQTCDFDQLNKLYTMRNNVHVILKNFDAGAASKPPGSTTKPAAAPAPAPKPTPRPQTNDGASILDSPGSFSNPNSSPLPQPANDSK